MAVAANKRSVMTMYSHADDMYSHQTRIVLAEKGVGVDIHLVDLDNLPEDLIDLNPYGTVPTLIDRELALYEAGIIIEYLDERFPHPPLMPVYPTMRALTRQWIYRVRRDWCYQVDLILAPSSSDAEKDAARKKLRESLMGAGPIFQERPFFMSDDFTLVDCCIASILWRLDYLGIYINKRSAPSLALYAQRLFNRESFRVSLSPQERELPQTLLS